MTLFLIMLMYLGMVVTLVVVGTQIQRRWRRWEHELVPDVTGLINDYADRVCKSLPPRLEKRRGDGRCTADGGGGGLLGDNHRDDDDGHELRSELQA